MPSTESLGRPHHSLRLCQLYGLRIVFGVFMVYVVLCVVIYQYERSPIDIVTLSSDLTDTGQVCGNKTNKIVADCLFRNYNYPAANSVKSRVLRRLNISSAIQLYKPSVLMNRTKLQQTMTSSTRHNDDLRLDTKRTCAVVGNGGILLDSGCEQEIDAHDFVIRSNIAEIKSYVHDVGSKTDIMTINAQRLRALVSNLLKNESTASSREDFKRLRFLNDSILWYVKNAQGSGPGSGGELVRRLYDILQYHRLPIKVAYSPECQLPNTRKILVGSRAIYTLSKKSDLLWGHVLQIAQGIWNIDFPTTGLLEYTFAAAFCDRISLYGFYPFSKGMNRDAIQHHYFENRTFNYKKVNHTFVREYQILTRLHWKGALRFTGDSCPETD